ncbi:hypothetical protein [Halomonas sp.]|uniref:hypothetical protein n=1 Tax=Halomonas sp. TaxID=1486246 RepID=UPI003D0F63B9
MSDLPQQIQQRAQFRAEDDLLRQMGYAKPHRRHRKRLASVLADPVLGLEAPMYDFVHGRRDFLRALCRALRIPEHSCRAFIAERDALEKAECQAYQPWLFVDTGFRRSDRPGMPLFALALLEHRRRLKLPAYTWRLPWEQQLVLAQARVREHMAESGGELKVWGRIQRYLFCYAEDHKLEIAPSGEVLGDASGTGLSRSSVTLKGKPIVLLNDDKDDAT